MSDTTKCPGMYVAVNVDLAPTFWLRKIAKTLTIDGEPVGTAKRLRGLCADARAKGLVVFPKSGCDHYDALGYCLGHDSKVTGVSG